MRTQAMPVASRQAARLMPASPGLAAQPSGGGLDLGPSVRPTLAALTGSGAPPPGAIVQRGKKSDNLTRGALGSGDTTKAGLHKKIKKQSKRKVRESEHMLPMRVTKKAFPGSKPDDEPTHSISYQMHRGGQSGAGGGITSTGSSGTAKGWEDHLLSFHNQGNDHEMFRQVAADTYNSAMMTGQDLPQTMVQIEGVLDEHAQKGRMTEEQKGQIMNGLMDRHYSERERLGQL